MPAAVRQQIEPVLNRDLSDVRIHSDAASHSANDQLQAKAFTHKNHVFLGHGQSALDTKLMAHESTHVVQQAGDSKATPSVQRLVVDPNPVSRKNRDQLLGDGTAANPGLRMQALTSYVAGQADWFTEPTLSASDRTLIWSMLTRLDSNPEFAAATRQLRISEVAGLAPADQASLMLYAQGFEPTAQTVRLATAASTLAEALGKGEAIHSLSAFVPSAVLRVVIPEAGLEYLINNSKIPELQKYFTLFAPTLENPEEWDYVESLLNTTVVPYLSLQSWVSDLHMMDATTLQTLVTNVGDTSRNRPVLLILFSATDHNAAFLQARDIRAAVADPHNLALVLQGFASLNAMATRSNDIARDYGQQEITGFDFASLSITRGPGRLGQVMIAGHGEHSSVEMGIGSTAPVNENDQYASYSGEEIDSATNIAQTQHLIDTLLLNMDPADAHVVFAGCLVGSHEFPASMALSDPATAVTTLRSHLASSQNLRDFVNDRMTALGVTGDVQAAQASATEDAFRMDSSGRAFISDPNDLNIGGTPDQYVQTGSEPEGALRAALETFADTRYGPSITTNWMRSRVISLKGDNDWYRSQTRSAYKLAVPSSGDASAAKILDLSHRVGDWVGAGWQSEMDVDYLQQAVHAGEEGVVYNSMLASEFGRKDHLQVGVEEAWMHTDASHVSRFENELTHSRLRRRQFRQLLVSAFVDPHLVTLMTTGGSPTRGQMLLALTIAVEDGAAMPTEVHSFLRAAAGGVATSNFPPGTQAATLLDGPDESLILEHIGLSVGSTPVATTAAPVHVNANIDLDSDSSNEHFIAIERREATVNASALRVHTHPRLNGPVIGLVHRGDNVRVMGSQGNWSLIDFNGKTGFIATRYLR